MGLQKWKARRPGAKAWDKLQARDSSETLAHRDVYEDQQLDRADIEPKKTATVGRIIAVTLGAIVAFIIWMLISIIALLIDSAITAVGGLGGDAGAQTYYTESMTVNESGEPETCYQGVDENGMVDGGPCYSSPDDVPVPDWYTSSADSAEDEASSEAETSSTLGDYVLHVSFFKSFLSLGGGTLIAVIFGTWVSRRVAAANLMRDTSDIKQHRNDQHIALPEEVQRTYDVFPDAGAHSSVEVSSLLSHTMLMRKGLPQVAVTKRADKDIIDEDGEIVHYAGEPILDANGDEIIETEPIIDEAFGKALFEASGLDNAGLQKLWDARTIPYNADGKNRDKLGKHKTVADLIKADWVFPDYERQRPAGVYNVDTAPVNTMVLAITRAGKGQTYIEPLIDMWSRERKPSNMVINDPKGELLVKFYVPLVTRGFNPVQFNLINAPNTDIYNPLGMAAEAAREGDSMKCAQYVENMADVFFPVDGSEDPVWPTAANNAFKRTAYGLIDFYLEEERELREYAALTQMDPATLEKRIDDLWGHVTLYNCYQLFVTLTSKKKDNPEAVLEKKIKAGEFGDDQMAFEQAKEQAQREAFLWEGKAELDMLTLFFNATDALPTNSMRTLVGNADKSLRAMAGAEKMLASVYGIAITAMNYFTDPTISRLTSGKPSQNTDLAGLSFPRRIGVRFAANYIKRENFNGKRAVWSAFADPEFTQDLGPDFEHADLINPEGWARYYFKGIFPDEQAWIKLEIVDPKTKMLMRSFYFHFKKNYQLTLNARHYVVEPVTNQKIVKNGVLRELRRSVDDDGTVRFIPGETQFKQDRLDLTSAGLPERIEGHARAIMQSSVRYSEAPTALFLITPPHLGKYAKLLLILIKQLVDLNFEQSYMTKSNQKPLYRTRFMFDELGNLRSDGQGISGFETMLSIGLGQEQQFTLILQTLQQLRDVYGESVDKIVQGNTNNIVYLKSNDDQMLEVLEKMSGTTHRSWRNSKQITQDVDRIIGGQVEGKVTYTMSTEKEPLISLNDLMFIPPRNSVVFRAGDAPIWNRNESILPMSWRLLQNSINHPGNEYSLQTIPTLSTAREFDVRMNQPDFYKMLDKRMAQALNAENATELYKQVYDYSEVDIERLDPDVYATEVMEIVQMMTNVDAGRDPHAAQEADLDDFEMMLVDLDDESVSDNVAVAAEKDRRLAEQAEREKKIYAEHTISRDMLTKPDGTARLKSLDQQISEAYRAAMIEMQADDTHFSVGADDELRSADGSQAYITPERSESFVQAAQKLNVAAGDPDSRVFGDHEVTADDIRALSTMRVHAAFYRFLASLPSWQPLAGGAFDRAMAVEMRGEREMW